MRAASTRSDACRGRVSLGWVSECRAKLKAAGGGGTLKLRRRHDRSASAREGRWLGWGWEAGRIWGEGGRLVGPVVTSGVSWRDWRWPSGVDERTSKDVGVVLPTVGRVLGRKQRPTLDTCACCYENLPKYRSYRVSNAASWSRFHEALRFTWLHFSDKCRGKNLRRFDERRYNSAILWCLPLLLARFTSFTA